MPHCKEELPVSLVCQPNPTKEEEQKEESIGKSTYVRKIILKYCQHTSPIRYCIILLFHVAVIQLDDNEDHLPNPLKFPISLWKYRKDYRLKW